MDDGDTGADSKDSPLVAITSITAGGIIMGFVAAFVAFRLCRNKRNTEEPFFGEIAFLSTVTQFNGYLSVTQSNRYLTVTKSNRYPL